ncbi:MAG: 2-C-methyl-D-erythritol 4-phosphate cytidylyltransferase [Pseudanabaenaceae cyanobacterium]
MAYLLIAAAGSGKRMGGDRNKLLLELLGKPVLYWTLASAVLAKGIEWIGIIAQPHDMPDFAEIMEQIIAESGTEKPMTLIEGGATRQESVFNGLQSLPPMAERVLIHDGARCLATPSLFYRCAESLEFFNAFITAVPVKDTIKVVEESVVLETPPRESLWSAQTPQGFQVEVLLSAHKQAIQQGWAVTDDASLLEKTNHPVQVVLGEESNIKITTPMDLVIAELILKQRMQKAGVEC